MKVEVPFLDLEKMQATIGGELAQAIADVIASSRYVGGDAVDKFEADWASYVGAEHAVGLGNGYDALYLAFKALDIGPGDEVIVPSHTFIATWLAVKAVGARIVPCEPDEGRYRIARGDIEKLITPLTKAIVVVHLYGAAADIGPVVDLAKSKNLYVIEDAAQAHGATYQGKPVGAHSDIVCWSFYPGKNLGALGDAGAITTDSCALAQKIRQLSNYGSCEKYVHDVCGVNSRLDPMQASVLSVKLQYLDQWNSRRAQIASEYLEHLHSTNITLPTECRTLNSVWHLFVVRLPNREFFKTALAERGVQCQVHYPIPVHLQNAFKDEHFALNHQLPVAEKYAREVLSLPICPFMDKHQIDHVIQVLRDAAQKWFSKNSVSY